MSPSLETAGRQFLSIKRRETIGTYIAEIEKSRSDIISDLQADNEFMKDTAQEWLATGRKETVVSLDEILNYISWREAFRKIKPNYDSDYIELISDIETEVIKLEKSPKVELSGFTDRQEDRVLVTGRQTDNQQARSDRQYGGARQKTYRGFQGQKHQYQGNSQSRTTGQNDRVKCYSCGKFGHIAKFCRSLGNAYQKLGGN